MLFGAGVLYLRLALATKDNRLALLDLCTLADAVERPGLFHTDLKGHLDSTNVLSPRTSEYLGSISSIKPLGQI